MFVDQSVFSQTRANGSGQSASKDTGSDVHYKELAMELYSFALMCPIIDLDPGKNIYFIKSQISLCFLSQGE